MACLPGKTLSPTPTLATGPESTQKIRRHTTGQPTGRPSDQWAGLRHDGYNTLSGSTRGQAARYIWTNRFFRPASLAMFIGGLGASVTAPQMTLFLVQDLHASLAVAGFWYLTNLAAPIVGFLIGSWSDRGNSRLAIFRVCATIGAAGWVAMALSTQVWMPFLISVIALSIGGAGGAQLFAAARDQLTQHPTAVENQVMAGLRMGWAGGWILGPVIGSWFGATFGLRPLLIMAAGCAAAAMLPFGRMRLSQASGPQPDPGPATRTIDIAVPATGTARSWRAMLPLLAFSVISVLAMSGDTMKFAYLPIFMAEGLQLSPALIGVVIGIQPLLEVMFMPAAAYLADRFDPFPVFTGGIVFAIGAYTFYALSSDLWMLIIGQILMSATWAAYGALGVTIAQQLYPQGVATASSMFMSSMLVGGALGGLLGGLGVTALGLPHVFLIPASLSTLAALAAVILGRKNEATRRQSPLTKTAHVHA